MPCYAGINLHTAFRYEYVCYMWPLEVIINHSSFCDYDCYFLVVPLESMGESDESFAWWGLIYRFSIWVFILEKKKTSYILVFFFLLSGCYRAEG